MKNNQYPRSPKGKEMSRRSERLVSATETLPQVMGITGAGTMTDSKAAPSGVGRELPDQAWKYRKVTQDNSYSARLEEGRAWNCTPGDVRRMGAASGCLPQSCDPDSEEQESHLLHVLRTPGALGKGMEGTLYTVHCSDSPVFFPLHDPQVPPGCLKATRGPITPIAVLPKLLLASQFRPAGSLSLLLWAPQEAFIPIAMSFPHMPVFHILQGICRIMKVDKAKLKRSSIKSS